MLMIRLIVLMPLLLVYYIVCQRQTTQRPKTMEEIHQWWFLQKRRPPVLDSGESLPHPTLESPDFREPEPPLVSHKRNLIEKHRPVRISPHLRMTSKLSVWDRGWIFQCTCVTVYKRLTPLGMCALLTTRHFITTASSTELVLKDHRHLKSLENILGLWYDTNHDTSNSSMYMSVSRIHYHPEFQRPERVNRSHPLPATFDVAVWASTYNVFGWYNRASSAIQCPRATSHVHDKRTSIPKGELLHAIGVQFMWAHRKKPTPFHKYMVRTRDYTDPCPKTEWGWFICIPAHQWARFGMDSGGLLFRTLQDRNRDYTYRWDGLVGLHTVSMSLRSKEITLYYLYLDTHVVLDFLYAAYMGRLPYEFLDYRFNNSQWQAPRPKAWARIPNVYVYGTPNRGALKWT